MKKRLIDRIWELMKSSLPGVHLVENPKHQELIIAACESGSEGIVDEKWVAQKVRDVLEEQKIRIDEDMTAPMPDRMINLVDGRTVIINAFTPRAQLKDLGTLVIMINIG